MVTNLEYYKAFYYVAKTGGITSAAQKLAVSQPAVSQAVRQLESILGTKLFCRTARGVALTAEGKLLFTYVQKGYEQIELGEQMLRQMLNLDFGEVRIGASDMTLQFYLLPFLESFHERYPGIKVKVTNATTPETLHNLRDGMIDFGVVSTPFENKDGFDVWNVMEIEDVFVAGRRFIQHKHRMLDFQELEKLPLILLEGNTSSRGYLEHFMEQHRVHMSPEFELATSDMIVQFALRNLGIGYVMRGFAQEHLDSGKLFELRFNTMIPRRHFCVVKDGKAPQTTSAARLLKMIEERMEF